MVGTGIPMLLDAVADRILVAPRYHGIEKAIGAAAGKVVIVKALATPPVDIVFELLIARERVARGAACRHLIGL